MLASRRTGSVSIVLVSARDSLAHPPILLLKISNGPRFLAVPLGFVTCPDLSRSSPVFIHMHFTLRVTHSMYLLLSQYLSPLVVRLLLRFAHS